MGVFVMIDAFGLMGIKKIVGLVVGVLHIIWYQILSLNTPSEAYMVSTHDDYKITRQELFPGLEQSRAPRMVREHHREDEEEDPRVGLD
jgi:hypothetical protein